MEILQFLLSFFLNEYGGEKFQSLLNIFKENSFDIEKVLKNLNIETLAPIIKDLLKPDKNDKTPTDFSVGEDFKLDPIARIADKDIVYTLNKYFN